MDYTESGRLYKMGQGWARFCLEEVPHPFGVPTRASSIALSQACAYTRAEFGHFVDVNKMV